MELENEHVHKVYNSIAKHFSDTRYKPWPIVESFLMNQEPSSLGVDVGCGNGKYLQVNKNVFMIGTDRSDKLIDIVRERGLEATVADGLYTCFQSNRFDYGISIAVIHHFSTPERRLQAIQELLRIVKPNGTVLIFVWAMEQEKNSKRRFTSQDEMVSWKTKENGQEMVYQRYYHLFNKGELDNLCIKAGHCEIIESGYDRDNHYVILKKLDCI